MSKLEEWVNSSLDRQREYARETLIVDVSEQIHKEMERSGVSKADIARLFGCSRPNVGQLLDGRRNMTLRMLADIARVLGCQVELKLKKVR